MSSRLSIAFTSLLLLAAVTAALVLLLMPGPADAGTPLTVTRFDDPPPGTCDSNDCSLREAIIAANAAAGADTITLPANPYSLSISGTDDDATAGDLDITDDLTINGAGSATTIIDGGAIDRVFNVRLASGTVSISGVTIQNGRTPSYENGGGIFNELAGTLTITNSVVKANNASYGGGIYNNGTLNLTDSAVSDENVGTNGGGIINDGTLTMTNSTVSGNFGSGSGGGVFNQGTATIIRSTVSGNLTTYSGGAGIYNESNLIITNSTVSGNLAATDGGGIQNSNLGTATITNSTITNNTADREGNEIGDGGGIASSGDTVSVKNTIVAGNADLSSATVEPDCFGTLSSQGHNFIETVSPGCIVTGATAGNVTGQPAGLGPLALNSPGTTQTHALLAGSPAIDAGSLDCPPPATDQRGVVRAQGGACDIGAYESPFTAPTLTPSPTPSPTPSASPTPTSSPTPTASPTPTPTHSPTPTGTHAAGLIQGDVTCDGSVGQPDFDFLLRFAAGLNDGTTPGDCPDLGEISIALAVAFSWGDVNCDGVVDAIDALYVLAHTVNVDLPQIGVNCIPIGGNIP